MTWLLFVLAVAVLALAGLAGWAATDRCLRQRRWNAARREHVVLDALRSNEPCSAQRVAYVTGLNAAVVEKELQRLLTAKQVVRSLGLNAEGSAFVLYRAVPEPEPRHLSAAPEDGGAA